MSSLLPIQFPLLDSLVISATLLPLFYFNPFRPIKTLKKVWEETNEDQRKLDEETAREYQERTGRPWTGWGGALIESLEDDRRLDAVRKRLGDRFDLLSQAEKLSIPKLSSSELAEFIADHERKFPGKRAEPEPQSLPVDDELEKYKSELKRKYDLKKIELEMEAMFQDEVLKANSQRLEAILVRHAKMFQRINEDSTLSQVARENFLRATEQTFVQELDDFTRSFR